MRYSKSLFVAVLTQPSSVSLTLEKDKGETKK